MRPLTFSDGGDHEQEWLPGGPDSAEDAFQEFVDRYRGDGTTSFSIEDEENDEGLLLLFGARATCRVKGSRVEYRLVTGSSGYRNQVADFVRGGFAALDLRGPWLPDLAALDRARLRFEFDGSALRRTHPRELRRRLEVLTRVDGREPTTVAGVTRYGYANGDGDTVDAWFTDAGRGLVTAFDHASPLASPDARAALYDGVPADLLALVGDGAAHPATGVFTFAGPCAMSDGLVARLQEARLGVEATGVGRLLEVFLVDDFTPDAVAGAGPWWSAEDVARGFAAVGPERPATAPLDREAVDRFCAIWADSGYNDRWDVHYVLFDGRTVEEAGETRDELLGLVRVLGLERVDTPPGAADGEVWVRTDPRVDAELGNWA